jgi:hypothetical protein
MCGHARHSRLARIGQAHKDVGPKTDGTQTYCRGNEETIEQEVELHDAFSLSPRA